MTALSYTSTAAVKALVDVTDTNDDTLLASVVGDANAFIETYTGRQIGPFASGTAYTFDGSDATDFGRCLLIPQGIQSVSLLEVAAYTGQSFSTIPSTDYFLRPSAPRQPGWPATELWMTDVPSGNNPFPVFLKGFDNIRVTANWGWAAIPSEVAAVATRLAVMRYRNRAAGAGEDMRIGLDGRPVPAELSMADELTLSIYVLKSQVFVV